MPFEAEVLICFARTRVNSKRAEQIKALLPRRTTLSHPGPSPMVGSLV